MKEHRDFTLFKKTFRKYQVLFGLTGWNVVFRHETIEEDAWAKLVSDVGSYTAKVSLNIECSKEDLQDKDIKATAKHECIHLLLARIDAETRSRYTISANIIEANEEAVHRLMEVIP